MTGENEVEASQVPRRKNERDILWIIEKVVGEETKSDGKEHVWK